MNFLLNFYYKHQRTIYIFRILFLCTLFTNILYVITAILAPDVFATTIDPGDPTIQDNDALLDSYGANIYDYSFAFKPEHFDITIIKKISLPDVPQNISGRIAIDEAKFYIIIMGAMLTILRWAISMHWLQYLTYSITAPIQANFSIPNMDGYIAFISTIVSVFIIAAIFQKKFRRAFTVALTCMILVILCTTIIKDPVKDLVGENGIFATGREIATGILGQNIQEIFSSLATQLIRHPFQQWNFGTIIDNQTITTDNVTISCSALWNSYLRKEINILEYPSCFNQNGQLQNPDLATGVILGIFGIISLLFSGYFVAVIIRFTIKGIVYAMIGKIIGIAGAIPGKVQAMSISALLDGVFTLLLFTGSILLTVVGLWIVASFAVALNHLSHAVNIIIASLVEIVLAIGLHKFVKRFSAREEDVAERLQHLLYNDEIKAHMANYPAINTGKKVLHGAERLLTFTNPEFVLAQQGLESLQHRNSLIPQQRNASVGRMRTIYDHHSQPYWVESTIVNPTAHRSMSSSILDAGKVLKQLPPAPQSLLQLPSPTRVLPPSPTQVGNHYTMVSVIPSPATVKTNMLNSIDQYPLVQNISPINQSFTQHGQQVSPKLVSALATPYGIQTHDSSLAPRIHASTQAVKSDAHIVFNDHNQPLPLAQQLEIVHISAILSPPSIWN